jgi:hypothetical protein
MARQFRNESVAVDTTSIQIAPLLAKEGEREVIVIKNTSTGGQKITISIHATAIAGAGIVLNPNETWTESIESTYKPAKEDYNVISDGAGGQIAFFERLVG